MRRAKVFVNSALAGVLTEDDMGYEFCYDSDYLKSNNAVALSLTLPLTDRPYRCKVLFPFFDGLIPERWMLDVTEQNRKISARDRFSLLLSCCKDCIGNVSIIPDEEEEKAEAMNKCLYCYKPLMDGETDYHKGCARKIFESTVVPELPYTSNNIKGLTKEMVTMGSTTVKDIQAKLSLDITRGTKGEPQRFIIVELWGRFVLKPQAEYVANLPENEDLVMHLAEAAGIKTIPHSLIRLEDGELCYITRRIDLTKKGGKIAMENMGQLTGPTEKGSCEQIVSLIRQYSSAPLLDVVNFWEIVVFSWLTGNTNVNLKNFSLYKPSANYMLTPAYDLLSTSIVRSDDKELGLTLNGKKKKIRREDFEKAMLDSGMDEKAVANLFKKFSKALSKWTELIKESFLPIKQQEQLQTLIYRMASRLRII